MRGDFSKRRPRSNNKFPGLDWVEDRQFGIWLGSAPGASLLPALYIALTMAGLAVVVKVIVASTRLLNFYSALSVT